MDMQTAFNIAVGLVSGLGGWILHVLWAEVKDLTKRVNSIDVLVAGEYITRDEHRRDIEAIFRKLDRIEDRLVKLQEV